MTWRLCHRMSEWRHKPLGADREICIRKDHGSSALVLSTVTEQAWCPLKPFPPCPQHLYFLACQRDVSSLTSLVPCWCSHRLVHRGQRCWRSLRLRCPCRALLCPALLYQTCIRLYCGLECISRVKSLRHTDLYHSSKWALTDSEPQSRPCQKSSTTNWYCLLVDQPLWHSVRGWYLNWCCLLLPAS